jgi:drug/metabolite transporter (DMT)-like permease
MRSNTVDELENTTVTATTTTTKTKTKTTAKHDATISSTTTIFSVVLWYSSNIGLLLTNKCLLSVYEFHYPIFITTLHMGMCFLLSILVRMALVMNKNSNDPTGTSGNAIEEHQTIRDIHHLLKVALLSVVFVSSVVSGNVSLRYIPVSFNQAISATTPFFTAILSRLFLCKEETRETYLALIPVVVGIVIASGYEPMFNSYGFAACATATFLRALKSVLQGFLLANEKEKLDAFSLLLFMSPIALAILGLACSVMEPNAFEVMSSQSTKVVSFKVALFLNCTLAFVVNLSNFMVTKCTSPLTLQVLGNAKSVLAVFISVMLFRNPISGIGMMGYCISVVGVYFYSDAKNRSSGSNKILRTAKVAEIDFKISEDDDDDDDDDDEEECEKRLPTGDANVKTIKELANRNEHHIL